MKLQPGKAYRLMPGATHVKVTKEGDLVAYSNRKKRTAKKKTAKKRSSKRKATRKRK